MRMPTELQVGVKILLKSPEGKYLLVRRSPKKYPEVGPKWDIVGGRIEPGSALLQNLKREVMEEVSLNLPEQITLIAAQDILRVPGRHVVRLTYTGHIEGKPKIDNDHIEFGWFSMDEIRAMAEEQLDIYFKELLDKGIIGEF